MKKRSYFLMHMTAWMLCLAFAGQLQSQCTLTCTGTINAVTDPGDCEAYVTVLQPVMDAQCATDFPGINLGIVNNRDKIYANGDDASDDYEVGTTIVTHCLVDMDLGTMVLDNTNQPICCNDTIIVGYTPSTIGCAG